MMGITNWSGMGVGRLIKYLKNIEQKFKRLLMQMLNTASLLLGGGEIMVDGYVALIIAGRRTFSQVPVRYQPAVHTDLLALGLDDDGNVLVTP